VTDHEISALVPLSILGETTARFDIPGSVHLRPENNKPQAPLSGPAPDCQSAGWNGLRSRQGYDGIMGMGQWVNGSKGQHDRQQDLTVSLELHNTVFGSMRADYNREYTSSPLVGKQTVVNYCLFTTEAFVVREGRDMIE
jgi:hypothetical protein